jgi:transposase
MEGVLPSTVFIEYGLHTFPLTDLYRKYVIICIEGGSKMQDVTQTGIPDVNEVIPMAKRRKPRQFTEEFKHQMVELYNAGKPGTEICRQYELTTSTFHNWVKRINATGSSKIADNRSEEEREMIAMRKELKQLRMENDILKQAALIFARKV